MPEKVRFLTFGLALTLLCVSTVADRVSTAGYRYLPVLLLCPTVLYYVILMTNEYVTVHSLYDTSQQNNA
jgi:hypothetical protein